MTPPTYSPWLRAFEAIGRFGFMWNRPGGSPGSMLAGSPMHDCTLDQLWRRFTTARSLYAAWSPPDASPWSAYAKPTLFAALGRSGAYHDQPTDFPSVCPFPAPGLVDRDALTARPHVPPATAVVLDLPGPTSVAYAAWLAKTCGFQPVPLFNNWPHPAEVVHGRAVLGALLYYVPWAIEDQRERGTTAPPVFMLDRNRLGPGVVRVRDFDNRYFHLESDLPSPAQFKRSGIQRVLYVCPDGMWQVVGAAPSSPDPFAQTWRVVGDARPEIARPVNPGVAFHLSHPEGGDRDDDIVARSPQPPSGIEMDDLNAWLRECHKSLGLGIASAALAHWELGAARGYDPAPRKTPFNTTKDPAFSGFRRNSAGGFGKMIPEPSSGGGGFG